MFSLLLVRVDDRATEVVLRQVVIVRAHELHEVAVHAQDDEHLELLVLEQRVALGEHVAGASEDAAPARVDELACNSGPPARTGTREDDGLVPTSCNGQLPEQANSFASRHRPFRRALGSSSGSHRLASVSSSGSATGTTGGTSVATTVNSLHSL